MTTDVSPPRVRLRLADEVAGRVLAATIGAAPVAIAPASPDLLDEFRSLATHLATRFADQPPSRIEGLAAARAFYREFGIDATKTRPSSEALFRRAVRGLPLPRVSNAVDAGNLISLRSLLPLGLYDAGKIEGDVVLRRGSTGESYAGIRKDDVHLDGRPVLADARGAFGNPTSDSDRTCVVAGTVALWLVIFAPVELQRQRLELEAHEAAVTLERHLAPRGGPPTRTCVELVGG